MELKSLTPVIATEKLTESRDFYTHYLGFKVIFENDWYIQLRSEGRTTTDVAFVLPSHKTQPPIFQPPFCSSGVIYTIEVDDAKYELEKLQNQGVKIELDLRDEPWGERHFAIKDPNGIPINISQPIEPSKEYQQHFK